MLDFKSVSKTYPSGTGEVRALDDVTFTLGAGDFIAVRGPSGCGKSTLLLTGGALLRPTRGTISLQGKDLYAGSAEDRARLRATTLGFVFQQFHLVPYLSVRDNVLAASIAAPSANAPSRADELLARFNMTHRAAHVPAELSTGERQRTALARALLNQPKLLLADEPTGNLDPENAQVVLDALRGFADEGGAVLLVTHDDRSAAAADCVMQMHAGRLETVPIPLPPPGDTERSGEGRAHGIR
ncbi:MAG: ABC transporter ATP-binding protein [Phycisphaeraceae bacterium]